MKKKFVFGLLVLIALFTITGCGILKVRTIDYLLKGYIRAYTKADLKATKDIFPPFYLEYNKKDLNQEYMDKTLKNAIEKYGDDFNITYKITKTTKMTKEELDKHNEKVAKNYKTDAKATECYKYEGTITFKGSKKEDPLKMSTMGYCKYNGTWYLIRI